MRRYPPKAAAVRKQLAAMDNWFGARQSTGENDAQFVDRLARAGCTCQVREVYDGNHRQGCPARGR